MHRSRKIVAITWIDSKPVWLLSTAVNPIDPAYVAPQWVCRKQVDFPMSPIFLQYQSNMRGVNVVDQYRHYYTMALQSQKSWHRCFTFVIDSSILNALILYWEDATNRGLALYLQHFWHYILAQKLVAPFVHMNIPRGPFRNLGRRGFHYSKRHPETRRQCEVCGRRTRMFCASCDGRFMCATA